MLAESYLHRLDPFAIQLTDLFGIRWYGLAYISGFVAAWLIIRWMGKKKFSLIPPDRAGDFLFATVFGVLAGGRLGYGLFYNPSMFFTLSSEFPWWEALAIHHGGMSSHGGMLGVLVAILIWGRKNKIPSLHLIDIGALCATPGLFFGRLANFIGAELWGKGLPQAGQLHPPWWSVKYPTEITEVWLKSPAYYEHELMRLDLLRDITTDGGSFHHALVSQMYAGNQVVIDKVQPLLTAWYPSQLFQALTDGPLLLIALVLVWWKPRKPGVIAGWFLIIYGLLRCFTEIFRQPDIGVATIMGLSRGQLLSVAMILAGIILAWICSQREDNKLGGFGDIVCCKNAT